MGDRLREQGHEFGTTTGRPRRCGWFDAVAAKYACRLNGCDEMALMKLDVLDGFEKIKVASAYEYEGERIDYVPSDLENVTPVYVEFDGWEKVEGIKRWEDLPVEAKLYIEALEDLTDTRIGIVSTSPDRADTIIRK